MCGNKKLLISAFYSSTSFPAPCLLLYGLHYTIEVRQNQESVSSYCVFFCIGTAWHKPVKGRFRITKSKIMRAFCSFVINFQIRVIYFFEKFVLYKIDIPNFDFHRPLPLKKPSAIWLRAKNLFTTYLLPASPVAGNGYTAYLLLASPVASHLPG